MNDAVPEFTEQELDIVRAILGKCRLNQSVRAEPVEAVANLLIRRRPISTSSMRTDLIGVSLVERYGHAVEVALADSEMLLDSNTDIFTTCPTAYWSHEGCHFVDVKPPNNAFSASFFTAPMKSTALAAGTLTTFWKRR